MADATLVDLVKITALTIGTGAVTLGDAVPGYRGREALLDGAVYGYSIQQEAEYEIGRCTYLLASTQIIRTPEFSSNGGLPINLQANASIAFVATAEDILGRDVLRPLYGYGAPTNNIGLIGQTYTDKNEPVTLYGPKTASGWGVGVVLSGSPGEPGETGPAASTYTSLSALKAAPLTNLSYTLITSAGREDYAYVTGDYTGKADNFNIVQSDNAPLTTGALVRVQNGVQFETIALAKLLATAGIGSMFIADRGGTFWRKWGAPLAALTTDQQNFSWFQATDSTRFYLATQNPPLEAFGAIGDYDIVARTGTLNTAALQAAFNYARRTGEAVRPSAGRKYLTDTLYMNYDATNNPVDMGRRPGRIAIIGPAGAIATGAQEGPGASFVHIDGAARPLIVCKGSFTISDPAAMGSDIVLDRINFVGGYQTTDHLYFEACQGKIAINEVSIKVLNKDGNGITENTTWEMTQRNVVIFGPAQQLAPTAPVYDPSLRGAGIGLNIQDNGSGGQTNMKVYINVNVYAMAYGVRIGRRASSGTFGPLLFLGGQASWADHHGVWVDGGCYNITFIGHQIENSRLNGFRVDSAGATDLAYQIKYTGGFFANNGLVEDGSVNQAHVYIKDGRQCVVEDCSFWDTRDGIGFDAGTASDFKIVRPKFRTVAPYGAASGVNIRGSGTLMRGTRIEMTGLQIDNGCQTQVNALAIQSFALARQFYSSGGVTAPNISLGFSTGSEPADEVLFDNGAVTAVSGFLGGRMGHMLRVRSTNSNTTLVSGANLKLRGDANLTVDRTRLFFCTDGLVFQEIG